MLTSIEMCAGAGGQALGLERVGFDHRCGYPSCAGTGNIEAKHQNAAHPPTRGATSLSGKLAAGVFPLRGDRQLELAARRGLAGISPTRGATTVSPRKGDV